MTNRNNVEKCCVNCGHVYVPVEKPPCRTCHAAFDHYNHWQPNVQTLVANIEGTTYGASLKKAISVLQKQLRKLAS